MIKIIILLINYHGSPSGLATIAIQLFKKK